MRKCEEEYTRTVGLLGDLALFGEREEDLLRGRLGVVVNASAARADSIRPALFKHPQPGRRRGGRTVSDVRFLPRWQQLEKTAFWYAERAARAPRAAERDRLLAHALAAWRASRDVEKMVLCFSILCLGSESRALPGTLPIFLSRTHGRIPARA